MLVVTTEQERKLLEWLDAGLISGEQAAAIRRYEATASADVSTPPPRAPEGVTETDTGATGRRVPLLGEALGYLGAALVAIAGGILLSEHWDRLLYGAKLALIGLLGLVLFAAGTYLRRVSEPAAQRLAGFTWALSIASLAWFVGVAVGRDGLAFDPAPQALTVSSIAALGAVGLWAWRPRWQQHLVGAAAVLATLVSLLSLPTSRPDAFFFGLAIAGLGLVWLLVSEAGLLPPPRIGRVVGLVLVVGGLRFMPIEPYVGVGLAIALLATAAMLAAGVIVEVPLLLGFGAAGVFLFVPQAVFHFFGETVGAPVALLLIGIVLIGTALVVVRARSERQRP